MNQGLLFRLYSMKWGEKRKESWIIFKARGYSLALGRFRRSDFTGTCMVSTYCAYPCDDKAMGSKAASMLCLLDVG